MDVSQKRIMKKRIQRIEIPSCIDLDEDQWNRRPFDENFTVLMKGHNFYPLDESGLKTSLLNICEIADKLHRIERLGDMVSDLFSQLVTLLALNIRSKDNATPLVGREMTLDFLFDSYATESLETPITRLKDTPMETQNAFRKIQRYDVIAPAIAWGIIRYFAEDPSLFEQTVLSEIDRYSRMTSENIPYPNGCMILLRKKLATIKNITFPKINLRTISKRLAVAFKTIEGETFCDADKMFHRQLQRFSRGLTFKRFGAWSVAFEIASENYAYLNCLLTVLDEDPRIRKNFAQAFDLVKNFHEQYAEPLQFHWQNPFVYAEDFDYMSASSSPSTEKFMNFLLDVQRRLESEANTTAVVELKDSVSEEQSGIASISAEAENEPEWPSQLVDSVAERYREVCKSVEAGKSCRFHDFWSGDDTMPNVTTKKRRHRRKK